jgi:hypothetical protein
MIAFAFDSLMHGGWMVAAGNCGHMGVEASHAELTLIAVT